MYLGSRKITINQNFPVIQDMIHKENEATMRKFLHDYLTTNFFQYYNKISPSFSVP